MQAPKTRRGPTRCRNDVVVIRSLEFPNAGGEVKMKGARFVSNDDGHVELYMTIAKPRNADEGLRQGDGHQTCGDRGARCNPSEIDIGTRRIDDAAAEIEGDLRPLDLQHLIGLVGQLENRRIVDELNLRFAVWILQRTATIGRSLRAGIRELEVIGEVRFTAEAAGRHDANDQISIC